MHTHTHLTSHNIIMTQFQATSATQRWRATAAAEQERLCDELANANAQLCAKSEALNAAEAAAAALTDDARERQRRWSKEKQSLTEQLNDTHASLLHVSHQAHHFQ
jgi:hypothetical protein